MTREQFGLRSDRVAKEWDATDAEAKDHLDEEIIYRLCFGGTVADSMAELLCVEKEEDTKGAKKVRPPLFNPETEEVVDAHGVRLTFDAPVASDKPVPRRLTSADNLSDLHQEVSQVSSQMRHCAPVRLDSLEETSRHVATVSG